MATSDYYETLSGDVKTRYDEKIKIIDNIDPYKLKPAELSLPLVSLPDVTIIDLVQYFITSHSYYTGKELKAYKSLQAYKYFESGAVLSILAKKVNSDACIILSKVRHSQRFREKPLETWVILLNDGSISSAHCTSMAGLGEVCSHVATVIFYIHAKPTTVDETEVACTSRLATWPVPPVKNVEMARIAEMDWTRKTKESKKENVPAMTVEETQMFLKELCNSGLSPAICRLMEPFASEIIPDIVEENLPEKFKLWFREEYVEKPYEDILKLCKLLEICITSEQIKKIESLTRNQSENNLWFEYRTGRITASKFKAVCRTSVQKPSLTVIKQICYPEKMSFFSKQTYYGVKHEKTALETYQEIIRQQHNNLLLETCGFFISESHPYLGASPDSIVVCDCCGKGCVEVKCPYLLKEECQSIEHFTSKKNTCLILKDNNISLDRNHCYFYQTQLQMFVTGYKYCDFVVWSKISIFIERIFFDSKFIYENIDKASEFYTFVLKPELIAKFFTLKGGSGKVTFWCICQKPEEGKPMLQCDNDNCEIQWFHFECLNLIETPEGNWFCEKCTLVPNRIFVGGISASTTEGELMQLFSAYGTVKAAKIIQDRAGVSKGYGFITFESEDDARRPLRDPDSIVLRERRLNIAPAIKKQPFGRPPAAPPYDTQGQADGRSSAPAPHQAALQPPLPPFFFGGAPPFYPGTAAYYAAPHVPMVSTAQAQVQVSQAGQEQAAAAQQAVYQGGYYAPPVYQAQTGPPQAGPYGSMMFPQTIYMPQQYPIMPYDYTVYGAGAAAPPTNGGVPPPFATAGPASNGGTSPPRGGPCYAPAPGPPETTIVYTGPPPHHIFHAATMDPTGGAPGPIYATADGAFDPMGPHAAAMGHFGAIAAPYGINEEGSFLDHRDGSVTPRSFLTATPPTEQRSTATPVVSLLSLDHQQEKDPASMQGGRRPPQQTSHHQSNMQHHHHHQQQPRRGGGYQMNGQRRPFGRPFNSQHNTHHMQPPPPPQASFVPPARRPRKPPRRTTGSGNTANEIGAGDAPLPGQDDSLVAQVEALKI